jgi:transcriptional regulator with XRE-family HTH domain
LSSNHQRALEALGARLRELRRTSGLNGKQFAAKLGWYGASRVSKLELGQQTPSEQDLVEWTTACNAPEALAELRIQLNAIETLYTEWRRQLYAGIHVRQREILELESEATAFREFVAAMVPGMLQTPDYARSLFERFSAQDRVPPTIDEAVRLRMQRQEALHRGKHFHFVLTEAVLRYTMVPPT